MYDVEDYDRYPSVEPLGFNLLCNEAIAKVEVEYMAEVARLGGNVTDAMHAFVLATRAMYRITNLLYQSIALLTNIGERMKGVNHGVFFIGAGVSFEGEVDWETVRPVLAYSFERHLPASSFNLDMFDSEYDDDWKQKFRELQTFGRRAVRDFQRRLRASIEDRPYGESHEYIAELLRLHKIDHLVCFNWDDLIERAYGDSIDFPLLFFQQAPSGEYRILWKPHGGVNQGSAQRRLWVLPHEDAELNRHFVRMMRRTRGMDRIVLCMGFSGAPNFDVDTLRDIFGGSVHIYDIRPELEPPIPLGELICTTSRYALRKIVKELNPAFEPQSGTAA